MIPKPEQKYRFIEENSKTIKWTQTLEMKKALQLLKEIHNSGIQTNKIFYPKAEILAYEKLCRKKNAVFFSNYEQTKEKVIAIAEYLEKDFTPMLCHIDFIEENILVLQDGSIRIIDWEYAAMSDPMMDLAIFIISPGYDKEDLNLKKLAMLYFDKDLSIKEEIKLYSYAAISGFYWSLWALYKECLGYCFHDEYANRVYQYSVMYVEKLMKMGFFDREENKK